jgi:hypothetical protein
MSGARILSMLVYMVFLLWCAGLETLLGDTLGAWTPALSWVLACAVIARAEDEDLWWLVPLTAIARAPFAPDEPSVLVGGTFLALWVALLVRRVLDAAGRAVTTRTFAVEGSLSTTLTFDEQLSAGVYMIETLNAGRVQTQRLVVQVKKRLPKVNLHISKQVMKRIIMMLQHVLN